ncbi:uncharacterized protein LOC124357826 [Homalodisca vitripennis]|nr:uncharacterized protein LOC124357826 [Homalodisca vitripennis]
MVFSPQSAPADGGKPTPKPETTTTTVIETKPPTTKPPTTKPPVEIKPSKTEAPPKTSEKKATLEKPKEVVKKSSVEVKVSPPSSVVFSSIVEVRGGPPQGKTPEISSKVEVRTGPTTIKSDVISTKVEVKVAPSSVVEVKSSEVKILTNVVQESKTEKKKEFPKPIVNVKVGTPKPEGVPKPVAILSSKVEVISNSEEPAISGNNVDSPAEYDFLSRQPSEIVDETYRIIDLRPTIKLHHKNAKPRQSPSKASPPDVHPTGLVTSMGGTVVKDGLTTVHETSVLGTYISGKYAQVLQSTSHIYQSQKKPKPSPVQSKILKTAAPSLKNARPNLEPTPVSTLQEDSALPLEALFNSPSGGNLIRTSRRPAVGGTPFKNRFNRNKGGYREETKEQDLEPEPAEEVTPAPSYKKNRNRDRAPQQQRNYKNNRFGRPSQPELATVSVYSEPVTPSNRKYQSSPNRRGGFRPSSKGDNAVDSNTRESRRGYKPKPSPAQSDQGSTSLYKFKLSRPTGRWQYKTTPKPRIPIRRVDEGADNTTSQAEKEPLTSDQEQQGSDVSDSRDLDNLVTATESTLPLETIKVEISTPAEFKNTYYEIATIKSPYTFQVGSVKNTRYITVTSTVEKSLVEPTEAPGLSPTEPLTENILASTQHIYDNQEPPLDSSIATLPPIGLAGDAETPPLETMTETFSTTQLLLKTHILPVVYGGMNTSSYTLVQSYQITRIVTATKTLPPMEVYQFVPSKTLNEFNTRLDEAGSELHLELEFGDNNDQDDDEHPGAARAFPPDLDLSNVGSEFDLSDVDKSRFPDGHLRLKKAHHSNTTPQPEATTPSLSPEQLQQLALLRFLNPNANIPQVITQSRPVIRMETIYESHVIPLFNGQSTIFSTLSRPIATVSKTEYEYVTSTLPMQQPLLPQQQPLNPLLQQQPQINPLLPQQPQFAVTSTPVVTQTVVTETDSKVLKLTFGAKTAYTTLFSTRVVPTQLTTYLTASVPVQPTAFPGFFPAPYNPFSFVG